MTTIATPPERNPIAWEIRNLIACGILYPERIGRPVFESVPEKAIAALKDLDRLTWDYCLDDVKEFGTLQTSRVITAANGEGGAMYAYFSDAVAEAVPKEPDEILFDIAAALKEEAKAAPAKATNASGAAAAPAIKKGAAPLIGEEAVACFHLTDAGNAKRLAAHLSGLGRYCYAFKAWYLYNDGRWIQDKAGAIFAAAKDAVKEIYAEAQSCGDDATRKAIAAHAVRSETERALKAMISLAQSEPGIPVSPSDFDQHPDLLNCLNGTVSLRTGKLKPHDPADLLTQLIPISFDEDAPRERWKQFLKEVFKDRQDLIDYLQRLIGYSLTGLTTEQIFVIFHGAGANGKSTLLDVLLEVFADYMTTTPFTTFALQHNPGIRNDLADLHNVRLVATSESAEGQRLNEALIKRATGDASIKARFLFKEFFTYKRKFKIIMSVNHLPKIRGTDHAIWRRVRLVPFDVVFEGENCDLDLPEKLLAEAPGILAWAVLGSMLWHDMGLGCPAAVKAATTQYKEDEDTLGCFLKEICNLDPTLTQAARPLYLAFKEYCGGKTMPEKEFSKSLEIRGYVKKKTKSGAVWFGLELLPGRTLTQGPKGDG